jgi:serine/threonine-protein kinase HipA
MNATIELYIDYHWQTVGRFSPDKSALGLGIAGSGVFEYDIDYTVDRLDNPPQWRVGLNYPVSFELFRSERWPTFLLDIIPSGAGRRVWLRRLERYDSAEADWELLCRGSGNPPGNMRIAEAILPLPEQRHPGFSRDEIVTRHADFIEYAEQRGAVVTGATDVQGDAPKFLVCRDRNQRWHPDGSLPDNEVLDCWLVKFPRGRSDADRTVLRNEAPYLEVARRFGLRVAQPLTFSNDTLFIPRFDRSVTGAGLQRHGFETLSSAAGVAEFGKRGDHALFCATIARHTAQPQTEIIEYLRRDILNCALRNTDNHGRNTALFKLADGTVQLTPLYDFAPMFLDPEGIPRSSRWANHLEATIGRPDWDAIVATLAGVVDVEMLRRTLHRDADTVARLPETMSACGVEDAVIERLTQRCNEIAADLRALKG